MTWLSGVPAYRKEVVWSESEGDLDASGTCLFNGLLLYWFNFTDRTSIYLADTRREQNPILISKTAQLGYSAHHIVLVQDDQFVSVQWSDRLILRLHALDGSLLRESTVPAAAAWGGLRVSGHNVSICVTSDPTTVISEPVTAQYFRLGSTDNSLMPDEILVWDTTSGVTKRVPIPTRFHHATDHRLISSDKIAMPGLLPADDFEEALICFSPKSEPRIFSPGNSSLEFTAKRMHLGIQGSTDQTDILVHSFDRIAVFDRTFLTNDLPDNPRTGRKHYIAQLLPENPIRVLPFSLPTSHLPLPSTLANRLLVCQKSPHSRKWRFSILDFDKHRVSALLAKSPEERSGLAAEILADNPSARVRVVSRQFFTTEEGFQDSEYPYRRVPGTRRPVRDAPPGWDDHLRTLDLDDTALVYDEAPLSLNSPRFAYTQSLLHLERDMSPNPTPTAPSSAAVSDSTPSNPTPTAPPSTAVSNPTPFPEFQLTDLSKVGITTNCVVFAPAPGERGVVWYFA